MTQGKTHLNEEQIERLLEAKSGSPTDSSWPRELEEARHHLAACEICQRLVSMHQNWSRILHDIRERPVGEKGVDCPRDVMLFQLAAGLMRQTEADELLTHITQCDYCGPILRDSIAAFSEDVGAQEQGQINSLKSSTSAWQTKLAQKLTGAASETRLHSGTNPGTNGPLFALHHLRAIFARGRLLWSGAVVASLALVAWFGLRALLAPDVNNLLANAYSERRIMDLRFPGAKNSPLRVQRGTTGFAVDDPQSLLEADALISRELRRHPNDANWLQAKARADLLRFRYDSAIETLQRALDSRPDSSPLMVDLASGYYQRAVANSGREIDYGEAINYLGRALAKTPDDPIALFNRASVEERLHLYDPAIDDWRHYLRIDSTGPWAEEARHRLAAAEEKLRNKQSSLLRPLLTVSELVSFPRPSDLPAELEGRVEEYQHAAVKDWLPKAFPQTQIRSQAEDMQKAKTALAALANVTETRHADPWLADLLSASSGSSFRSGVVFLSQAIRANDQGDYSAARRSAYEAARLFRSGGNVAGNLRSEEEELYSYHLLYEGEHCIRLARSLAEELQHLQYQWLRAQTSLEQSNCAALIGDLGETRAATNRGTREAEEHHYVALYLRGLGFQSDSSASLGDGQNGFSLAVSGLQLFWSEKIDLMKGYNFYTDLDTAADAAHFPYLQVALWRQATALIDLHPDIVQRAMAHRWLAHSAYLADMPQLAANEFAKASALFAAAPPTEATMRDQMDADIWLAGLEVKRGDFHTAEDHLRHINSTLRTSPSFAPEIGFYTTQVELSLRRRDPVSTESALRSAIFLAEWALKSFSSQNQKRQWAEKTESTYRDLVIWKLEQGDAISALEFWEWFRGAQFRAAETGAKSQSNISDLPLPPEAANAPPVETPKAVRTRLPLLRDRTVITYAVFQEGTAIWAYDDSGIFSQWVAKPLTELKAEAIQFQRLCSTPASDINNVHSAARLLYDLLISPVESRLTGGRTIVFEPDPVLAQLPWQALVDRNGRFLGQNVTIVISQSLYHTTHLRNPLPITTEAKALIVSVPTPDKQGLPPLPDADREAELVAHNFGTPHLLSGKNATLSAIQDELDGANVFHFVGHAVALPEINGLLLGPEPFVTSPHLFNADTLRPKSVKHLQLAVLSACDTGQAAGAGNSGTETLTDALLHAGVPQVVASRWSVDSVVTTELMQRFYSELLKGKDTASSLRQAQVLTAATPGSAHPYYWAAFYLEGI